MHCLRWGWGTKPSFIQEGSTSRINPLPFNITFVTENSPLPYTFYWQMLPISHQQFRTFHDLPFTAENIFNIWINHKTRTCCRLYHNHKTRLLQTKMTDFPTLSFHILQRVKSLPFYIPEDGAPSERSLPVRIRNYRGYPRALSCLVLSCISLTNRVTGNSHTTWFFSLVYN